VLTEIDAADVPQIVVFNKLDRLAETERPRGLADAIELPSGRQARRVFVSAQTGEGLALLREAIAAAASPEPALNPAAAASPESVAADAAPRSDGESDDPGNNGESGRTGTYHSHA
jgi:GTP-binding protein HflX